jgi:RNA polymerase sigma factor (sigma-70 family)
MKSRGREEGMVKNGLNDAMAQLRRTMLAHHQASDGELLRRFIHHCDEEAFEALVRRHGKMVLGVCRRLLTSPQDAEDAFQSVFLVLVRKATSIVPREMVGNWLYGVARQTAVRVRSMNAKRRRRETQVTELPELARENQERRKDLTDFLDEELGCLPEKYRVVIVLCDLEGKTHKQVAKQLGCPDGTVSGRLARARAILAKRLAKRGFVLPGQAMAICLAQNAASAALPPPLVSATVKASSLFALGQKAGISAKVLSITRGVLSAMLVNRLKMVVAVALMACVLGLGVGGRFVSGPTSAEGAQLANEKDEAPDGGVIRKARNGNSNWEYKVVTFASVEDEKATKQLNDLAAEGWHYVGLLTTGQQITGGGFGGGGFGGGGGAPGKKGGFGGGGGGQQAGGGFGVQIRSGPAVIFKRGKEGNVSGPAPRQ